jgi:hypothetical protein
VQDDSGEIDKGELATVMRSLGYSPTDKQLQDMVSSDLRTLSPFQHRTCTQLRAIASSNMLTLCSVIPCYCGLQMNKVDLDSSGEINFDGEHLHSTCNQLCTPMQDSVSNVKLY